MSVGPMGFFGSVAATPLAQSKGSDSDREAQDAAGQTNRNANAIKAENAAGVGTTDGEEHGTNERDADGRRIYEKSPGKKRPGPAAAAEVEAVLPPPPLTLSKDATGDSGHQLDLTG